MKAGVRRWREQGGAQTPLADLNPCLLPPAPPPAQTVRTVKANFKAFYEGFLPPGWVEGQQQREQQEQREEAAGASTR